MTEQFEVRSGDHRIAGIVTRPSGTGRYPFVILSHGLLSSKESSKYVALSEILLRSGIGSCRFDYHGCGESEGRIEETTLTIRIGDLNAVVSFVLDHFADDRRIGLLGSSFGGSASLVKAARDPRIRCVSLWATPYRLDKDEGATIDGIAFKNELYLDFARYDLLAEAQKVSGALVIHGDNDQTVPVEEGKAIYERIREPKELEVIHGADHTFSEVKHRDQAMNLAVDWFCRFLIPEKNQ